MTIGMSQLINGNYFSLMKERYTNRAFIIPFGQ